MTSPSLIARHTRLARRCHDWRGATAWRAGATSRQAIGRHGPRGPNRSISLHRPTELAAAEATPDDTEGCLSVGDGVALVLVLATAATALWMMVEGVQYVMSEAATLDVIRMFGGLI